MPTSSIDELLVTGKTSNQPATPEHQPTQEEVARETSVVDEVVPYEETDYSDSMQSNEPSSDADESESKPSDDGSFDDYGNEKPKPRTYTQDEADEYANKIVRERLARLERNNPNLTQAEQRQVQKQAEGFEYDADSSQSWQQQLEGFVEQTVSKMHQKQAHQSQQAREQQALQAHQEKFQRGLEKFKDFEEVVGAQGHLISDDMLKATRAMKDPAAFLYAVAKRAPKELERISRLDDPYQQVVEIGKLEERMKSVKKQTNAPRPVSRTQEDAQIPESKKKSAPSIEEQIAQDAARKLAMQKKRRG